MALWHKKRSRKITGGKYQQARSKRKRELGREPALTKIGTEKVKKIRTRGGNFKLRALALEYANVYDPQTKKWQKAKILKVIENRASRHYARMNVVTKGAVIETEAGKAKVTNRPGQEGFINAIKI